MFWIGILTFFIAAIGYSGSIAALPHPSPTWLWPLIIILIAWGIAGLVIYSPKPQGAVFAATVIVGVFWGILLKLTPLLLKLGAGIAEDNISGLTPVSFVQNSGILLGLFTLLAVIGTVYAFVVVRKNDSRKLGPEATEPPAAFLLKRLRKEQNPYEKLDVVLCKNVENKQPVILTGKDRFLHTMVLGPIGGGKTSRVLLPLVYQDLRKIAEGVKMGITVIEPNQTFVNNVARICQALNIPYTIIDPLNPASAHFNPLGGPPDVAAETMRSVLRTLFGKQEAFFAQVQETAAKNVILLLRAVKDTYGQNLDIIDVVRALRDPETLASYVSQLEHRRGNGDDLAQYFRRELLGVLKDKYYQFAAGLRQQLEDLIGNPRLREIMTGPSEIDLDKHLSEGGVLLVNTAMGPLGKLGDTFGQFVLMHFQSAVLRRPGNEFTRTPHFLYVDEIPRYVNPDLERMLAIGRQYRCGTILALQTLEQLELAEKKGFADIVMNTCRNKIIYGGLAEADARKLERQFGEIRVEKWQQSYDGVMARPGLLPKDFRRSEEYRPLYRYTDLMYLERYTFIYQIVRDSQLMQPGRGYNDLIDINAIKPPKKSRLAIPVGSQPTTSEKKEIENVAHVISPPAEQKNPFAPLSVVEAQPEKPSSPPKETPAAGEGMKPELESPTPDNIPASSDMEDDGYWDFKF